MKSLHIASEVYKENEPIDWGRIAYLKRNYSKSELIDWAKNCIYPFFPNISQNMQTRSAKELLNLLGL